MNINDFVKAHTLLKNQSGNEDIKETAVIISDLQGDWTITEATWEKQCEWRALKNGIYDCADKPSKVTWSAIAALEEDAKKVADFSN